MKKSTPRIMTAYKMYVPVSWLVHHHKMSLIYL